MLSSLRFGSRLRVVLFAISSFICLCASARAAVVTGGELARHIREGESFLTNLLDAQLNLLPEYHGSRTYWLFHDNYLAARLLDDRHPDVSRRIRSSLDKFGFTNSGKIEIVFNEAPRPLPFKAYLLTNVTEIAGKTIRTEIVTTNVLQGWEHYADLLLLAAMAQSESDPVTARRSFDAAVAMWDGAGLKDRATDHNGLYATYKLALYLIAADRLRVVPPQRDEIVARLLSLQSKTGGWITDYKGNKPIGLANVETTCLSLLALKTLLPTLPRR